MRNLALRVPVSSRVCQRIVSRREEPLWAKEILKDISVIRELVGIEKEAPATVDILFTFVGMGGWEDKYGGIHEHAVYVGYRETGVGRGEDDAYLAIGKHPDGTYIIELYGTRGVTAFYKGERIPPRLGPWLFSKRVKKD